jgi:hypothetical protein
MSYLEREIQLLKKLLLHFHSDLSLNDNQWLLLYFHLFSEDELTFIIEDKPLLETLQYLQDIIFKESFSTMRELMDFYDSKKLKLKKFLRNMFKEYARPTNAKIGK